MTGDAQRFAIQRQGGIWYTGRRADGAATWSAELAHALIFTDYTTAFDTLQRLQREGFQVRLFGVDGAAGS